MRQGIICQSQSRTSTRKKTKQLLPVVYRANRLVHASAQGSGLKEELKKAVANTQRGKSASPQQQADILSKVQRLEAVSPTAQPALSKLLSGSWSLLYTGPGRENDVNWKKRTGGVEGPFIAALQPLSANAVKSRGITQRIDAESGKIENVAEFRVANLFNGYLNVLGTVHPVRRKDVTRVDVEFTAFCIRLGSLPELKIPLGWPRKPTGWVETTFLDEDFRIGRGDKGSVFVTARKPAV